MPQAPSAPDSDNSTVAEKYAEAWRNLRAKYGEINLLEDPLGARISELINNAGIALIKEFLGTSAVALSLRYRDGQIQVKEPCLTFFVREAGAARNIPSELAGLPTDVIEAGLPVLLTNGSHTPGSGPLEPGCSISYANVSTGQTFGTFGCLVKDDQKNTYILSCAHVLSDKHPGQIGDPIVHPATAHGGTMPGVATFEKEMPLLSGQTCDADAAIAKLQSANVPSAIRYIGSNPIGTLVLNSVGVGVQKSGDATGLTQGVVIGLNGTVGPHNYPGATNVFFYNVIITTGMATGGDSGSILMTYNNEALGVLFAGLKHLTASGQTGYVAHYYSPIDVVLTHLGVSLV